MQQESRHRFSCKALTCCRSCSSPPLHLVSSLLKSKFDPPSLSQHVSPSLSPQRQACSLHKIFKRICADVFVRGRCSCIADPVKKFNAKQCMPTSSASLICKLISNQHAGSPESYMGKHGAGPDGLRGRRGRRGTWHDICLQEVRGISCFTSTRPGTVKVTLSAAKRSSLRGKSLPQGETDT